MFYEADNKKLNLEWSAWPRMIFKKLFYMNSNSNFPKYFNIY